MSLPATRQRMRYVYRVLKSTVTGSHKKFYPDEKKICFNFKPTDNRVRRRSLTLTTIWGSIYGGGSTDRPGVHAQSAEKVSQRDAIKAYKEDILTVKNVNCAGDRAKSTDYPTLSSGEIDSISKCPFHGKVSSRERSGSLQLHRSSENSVATNSRRRHSTFAECDMILKEVFPLGTRLRHAVQTAQAAKAKFDNFILKMRAMNRKDTAVKNFANIPGPRGLPLLGSVFDYTVIGPYSPRQFHVALRDRHSRFGKIFKEKLLSEEFVYVSDPKDVQILAHNEDDAPCRPHIDAIVESRTRQGYPVGITALQDHEWKRLRSAVNSTIMRPKVIQKYRPAQEKVTDDFIQFIKTKMSPDTGMVEDLELWISRWALESVAVVLLDTRLGLINHSGCKEADPIAERLRKGMDIFFDYGARLTFGAPLWKVWQTKDWKIFCQSQKDEFEAAGYYVDKKLKEIEGCPMSKVKSDQEKSLKSSSFLEHMMNKTDLERDESLTLCLELLAGGIDTSSNAVTFTLYELSKSQECQETLREFIQSDAENGIEGTDSKSSRYLRACVMEALRLHPLTFANMRKTKKDLVLSGYKIPSGTTVRYTTHLMHLRNEEYFPEPDAFIPDRWFHRDSPHRCTQQFVFTPFGHGARQCPGRRIAEQELDLLLRAIFVNFKVEYHHKDMGVKVRLFNCSDQPSKFTFIPLESE